MLDVRRLRVLHEFAHQGSIAATARSLGYTPSAVSQQLSALEREAGAQLLHRTRRSAELTDAGRMLAERAKEILGAVESAESMLAAAKTTVSGQVLMTTFPTAAVALMPRLAPILSRYPELRLSVRQARSSGDTCPVGAGEADIAIVDHWDATTTHGDRALRRFRLLDDPLVLAVPDQHPFAEVGRDLDADDLSKEPWLVAPAGQPSRKAADEFAARKGVTITAVGEFEGLGTILNLVGHGVGIALVPSLAAISGPPGVSFRHLHVDGLGRRIDAVIRAASQARPTIDATMRALHQAAKQAQTALAAAVGH